MDVDILHILFGAGGQGMPSMAWFRIWVRTIEETAKNVGTNFERLVQVMEGERENAKESTGKEEKNQLRKQEKENAAPQEREKEERELSTQGPPEWKKEKERELNSKNKQQERKEKKENSTPETGDKWKKKKKD